MTEKQKLLASAVVPSLETSPTALPKLASEPLYVPFNRAVAVSGLGRSTLYREAMRGRLRLVKAGRSTLVEYASLRALLDGLPAAQLTNPA